MVDAEIALRRFQDGRLCRLVDDEFPRLIADLDHLDVVVGTTVRAGRAADAGEIVDHDLPADGVAVDRAGRAADHAGRVDAMHAGVRDHDVVLHPAVADELRVVVVTRGAGAHAIVAARAAVEVDKHRRGAIDVAFLDEELDHLRVESRGRLVLDVDVRLLLNPLAHITDLRLAETRRDKLLDDRRRDNEDVDVTDRAQGKLETDRLVVFAIAEQLGEPENLAFAEITNRPLAVVILATEPGKAASNQD